MAKKQPARLIWSEEQNDYLWQEEGSSVSGLVHEDQKAWLQWLTEHTSFAFQGRQGHLSLLKEVRPRGDGYWYAYRRQGKRTIKQYAGRTANLSITHLEELARELAIRVNNAPSAVQASSLSNQSFPGVPEETASMLQLSMSLPQPPQISLLIPKLCPPRTYTSLLPRERLLRLLDVSIEQKLTILTAPAGFGKTTLVSTWLANRESRIPPVAWIALDSGDNDPSRFWHYFIAACQTLWSDVGRSALVGLHSQSSFPRPSLEIILTTLLNDLARMPERAILVLEDYHVIVEPEIQQSMRFLLEHLPANLHLILLTRSEPLLPLAQLRARGELTELGVTHLRFSLEETRAFLRQVLPFPLADPLPDRLLARTEGWATGLRLISLALKDQAHLSSRPEIEQMLATISGSQRHILDYLVSDVLSAQPEPFQRFLLQTSGLGRLTGSLCDMVTGRNDSASLLEQIERANLFLLPLEETWQWYRYHTLFAEAMQHEAARRLGEETLHVAASKASHWYEQHDFLSDAVEAAFTAGEMPRAAELMTRIIGAHPLLQLQELHTFLRWLGRLPEEILRDVPILSQAYAMVLLFCTKRPTPALKTRLEVYLQIAEDKLRAVNDLSRLGEALALHALIVGHLDDLGAAIRSAREALELLPAGELFWRGIALSFLGMGAIQAGRFVETQRILVHISEIFEQNPGDSYARRGELILLGHLALGQGRLSQADLYFRQVLATTGDDRLDRGLALIGLATLCYEWNQLASAKQYAQDAAILGEEDDGEELIAAATILLARISSAAGERVQAQEALHQLATRLTRPRWLHQIEAWLVRFAITNGDLTIVQHWSTIGQTPSSEDESSEIVHEQDALLTARLLWRQGEAGTALKLLEHWLIQARAQKRFRSELEILTLIAQVYFAQQRPREAISTLTEALSLARSAGYRRIFLDEGVALATILRACLPTVRERSLITYIRGLLQALVRNQEGSLSTDLTLVEPLSPQERKVLRLLVAGRMNPEIAHELVVSLNTVKTQVKSIYRKLNVSSRLEAREVARQLDLH
jgi:LuxR family maltose regulon positive regulatory protein